MKELYISKGAKKENALASRGKSCLPKHDLIDRENNSLEQAACLHEVKVVCFLPIAFLARRDNNDGRPLHGT